MEKTYTLLKESTIRTGLLSFPPIGFKAPKAMLTAQQILHRYLLKKWADGWVTGQMDGRVGGEGFLQSWGKEFLTLVPNPENELRGLESFPSTELSW